MVNSGKIDSLYELLAKEAAKGDEEAGKYIRDTFALKVSLQKFKEADEIARESGMTRKEQLKYVRPVLDLMDKSSGMGSRVDEIKKYYNIR